MQQESSENGLLASQAHAFAMSVKRLAMRRMFVLHPFATMPGSSGEHSRTLAQPELESLATLVFEGCDISGDRDLSERKCRLRDSILALVSGHVELVCRYASQSDKISFLRWVVEFDMLAKNQKRWRNNVKETGRKGNGA